MHVLVKRCHKSTAVRTARFVTVWGWEGKHLFCVCSTLGDQVWDAHTKLMCTTCRLNAEVYVCLTILGPTVLGCSIKYRLYYYVLTLLE